MKRYCNFCGMDVEFTEYSGNSHAELWGNSHAVLRENSHAELRENSHAELWENSHAELRENSHAVLWENSHAELWENSHAVLLGNSHAELLGNSHAELRGNSHAVLLGNSHAVLLENSHAQCRSPYACGILKSITAECIGRSIGSKPIAASEWLEVCGVEVKNKKVILYKSVTSDFTDHKTRSIKYAIGKITTAPDWDADFKGECGKGLHLCPTIQQCLPFNNSNTYLACQVKVTDIASLPAFAEFPDKIRVRACKPLYQVDKDGNKL
jgi:hypothetical protein